jgi:hypothetical protein
MAHGEPYGESSRQRLSNLLLYTEKNEHGEILGTIFLNGEDICLDQIAVDLARFDLQAAGNISTSSRELYAGSENCARNNGYFRKDGTYVAPHKRTAPDDRFDNNWTLSD